MLASSYLDKNEKKISLCYITVFIRFTDGVTSTICCHSSEHMVTDLLAYDATTDTSSWYLAVYVLDRLLLHFINIGSISQ